MAKKSLDLCGEYGRDSIAEYISHTWHRYHTDKMEAMNRWKEIRNYVFATDTTTTTNKSLPWKNSTTLPKLCQIRDNLHSNYVSALFPNDQWLKWEAYNPSAANKEKVSAIEAYMENKTRIGPFRNVVDQLVFDYIDYGNVFATVEFESSYRVDKKDQRVPDYIGPKPVRISPYDIVFNPLASSFADSFKIIRSVKTISDLVGESLDNPDKAWVAKWLEQRAEFAKHVKGFGRDFNPKEEGMLLDGFGSYQNYLESDIVEVLDFYGDYYNSDTKVLQRGRHISVIDRMWVVHNEPYESWFGSAPIFHVGWRTRPDNLWSMGPLENLVGMQYRIDHLENLKADAMDLAVLPPLVIKGEVEDFTYAPNAEIHIDENGEVTELARNVQWVLQADNAIDRLEMRMEQYAGAPREAMGIRTAGEKTKYEVQTLENASGRIFQEKVTNFEINMLEKLLNAMLETATRNMEGQDIVMSIDDDLGVRNFLSITKADITAAGVIRPIGARHFAAEAQLVQNLTGLANTPIWQQIAPHMSNKAMANLVEDVFGLTRYTLFRPNVAIFEQQETQRLVSQAGEDLAVEQEFIPPQ